MGDCFTFGVYFCARGRAVGIAYSGDIKHIYKCLQNQSYNDTSVVSSSGNGRTVFLSRMALAGSFSVIGIPVVSPENVLISTTTFSDAYLLCGISADNMK